MKKPREWQIWGWHAVFWAFGSPLCLRTIFLEILNGTNYRNHPYLDGKTKVPYGYSLKPIHWHLPFRTVKNQCLKPPGCGCRQLSYNGGDTFGEQRNRSLMQQKLSVLAVGVSDHKKSALVDTTSEMQSEPFPTIVRKILFPPETVHTVCRYLYIYICISACWRLISRGGRSVKTFAEGEGENQPAIQTVITQDSSPEWMPRWKLDQRYSRSSGDEDERGLDGSWIQIH